MYNKDKKTNILMRRLYKVEIEGENIPYIVEYESLSEFLEQKVGLTYTVSPYALYISGEEPC